MGFIKYRTSRVEFDGDFYVVLQEFSQGKAARVEGLLTGGTVIKGDASGQISEGTVGKWQIEEVAQSIVDWNLTDENDSLLPLEPIEARRAALKKLPKWAFERIWQAARTLNEGPGEEAAKQDEARFPDAVSGSVAGADDNGYAPESEDVSSAPVVLDGDGNAV